MLSIKNLLFLAIAVTGSVIQRDAKQTKSDLQLIDTDTRAVTSAVNAYNGGGALNALPIVKAQDKLSADVRTATSHAKATGVVSEADAAAIIGYIQHTLRASLQGSLSALKSKKAKFAADGVTPTVRSSLQSLKSETDKLGAALVADTPPSKTAEAKAVASAISAGFADAIAFFS
ncbi:hypothetical protein E4U41_000473 [Claviceps citrina]|nr:hypothetical protein E4U41_000473 [Claviceps citrina]